MNMDLAHEISTIKEKTVSWLFVDKQHLKSRIISITTRQKDFPQTLNTHVKSISKLISHTQPARTH